MLLYIIRGIPGTGKSTLAKKLTEHVYEADQFFINADTGAYEFNPEKLDEAHRYCQTSVISAMAKKLPVIAVANTFTRRWEIEPYYRMANAMNYTVIEITLTNAPFNNIHNVPVGTIMNMLNRWER